MDINTLSNDKLAPVATAITTGASPVSANPDVRYYEITSGGTAGTETIELPKLPGLFSTSMNGRKAGQRINFVLAVQTDPSDVVKFTTDGSDVLPVYQFGAIGFFGTGSVSNVSVYSVGQMLSFIWCTDTWMLDLSAADGDLNIGDPFVVYLPATRLRFHSLATTDPAVADKPWVSNGNLRISGYSDANQGNVRDTFYQDFTATFGAITALTGNDETVTITGLLTTDQVHVQCISAPPSGMIIANARVSAADTLEVKIVTAVALGITLGALNFRVTVIR